MTLNSTTNPAVLAFNARIKEEALAARNSLKLWYGIFLSAWLLGLAIFIFNWDEPVTSPLAKILFFGSVIPYVGSIVFAYQVQCRTQKIGLTKGGGASVVVAGIFLNPYFLGFYIPLSVLIATRELKNT